MPDKPIGLRQVLVLGSVRESTRRGTHRGRSTDGLGNYAILRMPGRRFPGVVVQDDSLSILAYDAQEVAVALSDSGLAIAEQATSQPDFARSWTGTQKS
jgi:Family of unknown function (DUF6959)